MSPDRSQATERNTDRLADSGETDGTARDDQSNDLNQPARDGTASASDRELSPLRRAVFLAGSGLFFLLAVLGILLPVLPTTPFLLLTSYFLVRSSPRLNAALLRSRTFGPILVDWQVHGGVRRDIKIKAIVVVIIAIGITIYVSGYSLLITSVVSILASIGILVIVCLPIAREPVPADASTDDAD